MGSINTKDFTDVLEVVDDVPCTPMMNKKMLDKEFDPRSPTTEIVRY